MSKGNSMSTSPSELPKDLPRPRDDGAASHLGGTRLPDLTLPSTDGGSVHLATLVGRFVLYIYPMTGRPDAPLPGGWDAIPGAPGCTPQACSFRDHYAELKSLRTGVFGLSAQTSEYQREANRSRLPTTSPTPNGQWRVTWWR